METEMANARNQPISFFFDFARLGVEAWMVMGLRLAKLAAGGPAGAIEAQRMVPEKAAAAFEAQLAAGVALATGVGHAAAGRKAIGRYQRRVRANRRRLMRKR
jgi:hypothetical protein